jgi:hypothetical protein
MVLEQDEEEGHVARAQEPDDVGEERASEVSRLS